MNREKFNQRVFRWTEEITWTRLSRASFFRRKEREVERDQAVKVRESGGSDRRRNTLRERTTSD